MPKDDFTRIGSTGRQEPADRSESISNQDKTEIQQGPERILVHGNAKHLPRPAPDMSPVEILHFDRSAQ